MIRHEVTLSFLFNFFTKKLAPGGKIIMKIYADNAATTRMSKPALEAWLQQTQNGYGNPSSPHSPGQDARRALERARVKTARAIGAKPEEIFFTSGGTEANNWAIQSAALCGGHIVSTKIEHPSVLNPLRYLEYLRHNVIRQLERGGVKVKYLDVDEYGQVSPQAVRKAIRFGTVLITVMLANNEIGTILPIREIADIAQERGIPIHTDAVQAVGHIPIDVKALGVDMLSISGHKFGAGYGVGALYIKKGLKLEPFMHGGGQERGLRSGTEDIPGICAFAAALEDATLRLGSSVPRVTQMRDRLIHGLLQIPRSRLTGDPQNRLPGLASFVFDGAPGDQMVLMLNQAGIYASAGSACTSGATEPSHVLLATGLSEEAAQTSLRLSINEDNTDKEIDYILEKVPEIIAQLRAMSPSWQEG